MASLWPLGIYTGFFKIIPSFSEDDELSEL
jgi:hypothetical protein